MLQWRDAPVFNHGVSAEDVFEWHQHVGHRQFHCEHMRHCFHEEAAAEHFLREVPFRGKRDAKIIV